MSILPQVESKTIFMNDFEGLIEPVSANDFLDNYWGKSILVLHRRDRDFYRGLFSLADVDACLMTAANSTASILHIVASPGSNRSTTQVPVSAVSKDVLYNSFLSGDTIRLIGVEKFWPSVWLLVASLRDALEVDAGVNLFLTPSHSQAFPIHFDTMDGFIIQVAGSKRWRIWRPTYELPLKSPLSERYVTSIMEKDQAKLSLIDDLVLEAGDVLYLPRGFYHEALAINELSLHLTVSMRSVTWVDFLRRALDLAALEDPYLRQDLPVGFITNPGLPQEMQEIFGNLLEGFCGRASFGATLRSLVEEQVAARVFPPDGHFATLFRLQDLGLDSVVERRLNMLFLVSHNNNIAVIRFGPRRVQGPLDILPALEFIRDHQRFRVGDLPPSITPNSKITLISRLVREGALGIVV